MSDYYKLDFSINPNDKDAADLLAAFLGDEGFESFEETQTGLAAYVQKELFNPEIIDGIVGEFPMQVNLDYTVEHIPHKDWNEEWEKKYFNPLVLNNGKCVIHSSFHKDYPAAEIDVVIDPKMAFGTGHHATTSMMVEFIFESEVAGKKVLDMGTGTGILAIIAKKLNAGTVVGIEIDPSAYENALENIAINHVDALLLQGDAKELESIGQVDIFLANINRNIILNDLKAYIGTLKDTGVLLLSGFYETDIPLLENALELNEMTIKEIKTLGEGKWAAIKAVRKD